MLKKYQGSYFVHNNKARQQALQYLANNEACATVRASNEGYELTIIPAKLFDYSKDTECELVMFKGNGQYVATAKQVSRRKLTIPVQNKIDDEIERLCNAYLG